MDHPLSGMDILCGEIAEDHARSHGIAAAGISFPADGCHRVACGIEPFEDMAGGIQNACVFIRPQAALGAQIGQAKGRSVVWAITNRHQR